MKIITAQGKIESKYDKEMIKLDPQKYIKWKWNENGN